MATIYPTPLIPSHQHREFILPIRLTCPYCGHIAAYQIEVCRGSFPPPKLLFCGSSKDDEGGCGMWFATRVLLHIEAKTKTWQLGEQDVGGDPDGDAVVDSDN